MEVDSESSELMPSEAIFVVDVVESALIPFSSVEVVMLSQVRRGPLQQRRSGAAISVVAEGGGVDLVLLFSGAMTSAKRSASPMPPSATTEEIEEEEEEDETAETELFPTRGEGAVMEEAGGRREFWNGEAKLHSA